MWPFRINLWRLIIRAFFVVLWKYGGKTGPANEMKPKIRSARIHLLEELNLNKCDWIALRMPTEHLREYTPLSEAGNCWKMAPGGRSIIRWGIKTEAGELAPAGPITLPVWDPQDASTRWLKTVRGTARSKASSHSESLFSKKSVNSPTYSGSFTILRSFRSWVNAVR